MLSFCLYCAILHKSTRNWGNREVHLRQPEPSTGDIPRSSDHMRSHRHEDICAQQCGAGCDGMTFIRGGAWMGARGSGGDPYPAKVRLVGLPDLLALGVAAMRDDVNDSVFVGS